MSISNSSTNRGLGLMVFVTVGLGLLSTTGTPNARGAEFLASLGVDEPMADVILHTAPVIVGAAASAAAQAIGKRIGPLMRYVVYALLGMATGYFLGFCLDLFAGLAAYVAATLGPSEAETVHVVGWALTALSVFWGTLMGAIAMFGSRAARAMQDASSDPENADVRPSERRVSGLGAVGMLTQGVCVGALTLLDQTGVQGQAAMALSVIGALTALASAYVAWRMWRGYDEFMRRQVVNAYALSSVLFGVMAIVLVIAQSLGGALVTLTPYGVLLTVLVVQTVAAMVGAVASQTADVRAGRPA